MRTSTEKALDQIRERIEESRLPVVCIECSDLEEARLIKDITKILDSLTP